ncbi:non-hydrolyzing UDP-N-acetylglucosamine 2-epimerase [Desulfosporosinus hippei]|uniref:UDP-N-acetylglucosamine 2-epimerase (Non-hydrolysing)/UDP-GlcNAc3NAcA epimerase n=1 Tax=Desulfosporosinus hippei DSM 8344 TaxID=1121419 RepID=A0A1G7U6S6_9FIRM|nr:UDP-N-acetylglucosamine 2-epimerase (non-hydrolyzing) [Desulfosporosinus hippei]SDG43107.1 UDP-N-acetylglucosamine 2-epimerase (non-hydrolysing)/UDP-GlcNAc3NAcA epimerase [Desulfosporosinus hippei DSM 8344]
MKIATVVGARPQFIKAASVSRVLRNDHQEILIHTGQHYDTNMSDIFFDELHIPRPDFHLGIGSGLHGAQTGAILEKVEDVLIRETPDALLVYGDTNSTLAGALAASKLHIPVIHIEAGLRSFNRRMPEEINRVLTDHLSSCLSCPTETAVKNLKAEGITEGVSQDGDVMYDAFLYNLELAKERSTILQTLNLDPKSYILCTIHRAENTDDPARLTQILKALAKISTPVVLPLHPRTRKIVQELGLSSLLEKVKVLEPVGYLDMITLEAQSQKLLTDSGGVQKEAYFAAVPCITMRDETEWVETVDVGWNRLTGADEEKILEAVEMFSPPADRPGIFGDGQAAEHIVATLKNPS